MKITVTQYATSLYEAVSGKSEAEVKIILRNFAALLGRQQDLNKESSIIKAFNDLWNKGQGLIEADLVSTSVVSEETRAIIVNYLKDRSGAKQISLTESQDKSLIGGFVLKYNNKILDGSLRSGLHDLRKKIAA
jgi:F-type H+-transporting ATPase subunit delta